MFRRQIVEAGRDRLAGTVIAATPPSSRVYTSILLVCALAFAALLVLVEYPMSQQVRGVVAYDGGIARIFSNAQAEVRQIHVRPGQHVEAGAPLVTIALAQGPAGLGEQLARLEEQNSELLRQEELLAQLGSSEVRSLEGQRTNLRAAIASLERQRRLAAGQVQLAQAAVRRAELLASEGAGTQRQVEDSRSSLLARRSEYESLGERLIEQREQLRSVEASIGQRAIETARSRSEISARRAALAEQQEALARGDRLVLTAPVAGEVGEITAQLGQRARPEESLVTILPAGSRTEIWLYAPSSAVGFARPGQQVRLNFDAFPYQRFGAGLGTVTAVSPVPSEPAAVEPGLGLSEPVYRIRVRIDETAPGAPEGEALRPGMTLSGRLVLERRRLWEMFFNPVVAALGS